MKITWKQFEVIITADPTYDPDSVDNPKTYRHIYTSEDFGRYKLSSRVAIVIKTDKNGETEEFSSAFIGETGGATAIHDASILREEDILMVCACDKVLALNLPDLTLKWKMKADDITCFGIHRFGNGFLVHGECQLTQLNLFGEQLWTFSGRDIFVTLDNRSELKIENGRAIIEDFEGYQYTINTEGHVVDERQIPQANPFLPVFETNRLSLKKVALSDAEFIYTILNSPTFINYIGDRNVTDLDAARAYIQKAFIASYETNGFGMYKMVLKENQVPIGLCGIVNRPRLELPDIGYAILPEYEGKGYTSEAAAATLSFAQNELGLEKILAITSNENIGSQKLLEKIGMTFLEKRTWEGEEGVLVYEISKPNV